MNKAAFKLEAWFIDELLSRLDEERKRRQALNVPIKRSILAERLKAIDDKPYGEHTIPTREHIEILIQNSFWASLQKEEGQSLRFTIGYIEQLYDYDYVLPFKDSHLFAIKQIVKLAPAVKESEAAMLVYPDASGALEIWGTTDFNPALLTIKVLDPGQLIASFGDRTIAVISGYESVFISDTLQERTKTIWSKLGSQTSDAQSTDDKVELIRSTLRDMRASGRGGTLLIVPDGDKWRQGIASTSYLGRSPLRTPHNLVKEWATLVGSKGLAGAFAKIQRMTHLMFEFDRVPKSLAQLTDVDGATIITRDLDIVGFGAKIKYDPKDVTPPPTYKIDSLEDEVRPVPVDFAGLGGMRHQSAAHFVTEQHEAIALVVSQDGNFSAFVWEDAPDSGGCLIAYTRLELILF